MNGFNGWIEVFRAGKHTTHHGKEMEFTEADLDKIASYDPKAHEAPVVIGHPKVGDPAVGWVEGLKREGNKLLAKMSKLHPAFSEAVKDGWYKKRSISLYPDKTLRHIGFLGAMPPAVKGLAEISFAEGEPDTFEMEFSEDWKFSLIGSFMRRIREYFIAKDGTDAADKIVSDWEIQDIKTPEPPEPKEIAPAFNEPGQKEDEVNQKEFDEMKAQLAEMKAQLARANEALASKDAQIKSFEEASAKAEIDRKVAAFSEFCEGQVKAGKLTPAQRDRAIPVMRTMASAEPLDFSEGGKTEKKAPAALLQEILSSLPVQVDFSEFATSDRAGAPAPAKEAELVKLMAEGTGGHQPKK